MLRKNKTTEKSTSKKKKLSSSSSFSQLEHLKDSQVKNIKKQKSNDFSNDSINTNRLIQSGVNTGRSTNELYTPYTQSDSETKSKANNYNIFSQELAYERLNQIKSLINSLIEKIKSDPLLHSMLNNNNSQEDINKRLSEIIKHNIISEQESTIIAKLDEIAALRSNNEQSEHILKNTNSYLSNLKGQLNEAHNSISNLEYECSLLKKDKKQLLSEISNSLEKEIRNQKQINEKLTDDNINLSEAIKELEDKYSELLDYNKQAEDEIDRLTKIINVYDINLSDCDDKLKEKQNKIENLQQEMNNEQSQLLEISLKLKSLAEENENIKNFNRNLEIQNKELLSQWSKYEDNLNKLNQNKLENFEKSLKDKLTEKIKHYEDEVKELKQINNSLENELSNISEQHNNSKESYNQTITKMQNELKLIKQEYEKKYNQLEKEYTSDILKIKQDFELENLKIFQKQKIDKEESTKEIGKLQETIREIEKISINYIKIDEHNEIVDNLLNEVKNKYNEELQLKERKNEEHYKNKFNKLETEKKSEFDFLIENYKKNISALERKNYELEIQNSNLIKKLEQNHIFVNEYEKKLLSFNQFEKLYIAEKEKLQSTTAELDRLNDLTSKYKKDLLDNNSIINKLNDEIDKLMNMNHELNQNICEMTSKYNNILNTNENSNRFKEEELNKVYEENFFLKEEINNMNKIHSNDNNKIDSLYNEIKILSEQRIKLDLKHCNLKNNIKILLNTIRLLQNDISKLKKDTNYEITAIKKVMEDNILSITHKSSRIIENSISNVKSYYEDKEKRNKVLLEKTEEIKKYDKNTYQEEIKNQRQEIDKLILSIKKLKNENNQNEATIRKQYDEELEKLLKSTKTLRNYYDKEINLVLGKLNNIEIQFDSTLLTLRSERDYNNKREIEIKELNQQKSLLEQSLLKAEKKESQLAYDLLNKDKQIDDLNSKMRLISNDLSCLRKDYESMCNFNIKKEYEIQSMIDKSLKCYDKTNISISKKLDEEIKDILYKLKSRETDN